MVDDVDLIVEGSSLQGFLADPKGAHSKSVPGQAGTHSHYVSTAVSCDFDDCGAAAVDEAKLVVVNAH